MKKMMAVGMIAVVMVIGFLARAAAEEAIIGGYKPGEFAVKGQAEEQVLKAVSAIEAYKVKKYMPIESGMKAESGRLQIKVVGSADSIGISAVNDRLSKDRAEAVAAELASYFPEARIMVVPKGDQENLRQVKVEYYIALGMVSQPLTKKQPLDYKPELYLAIVLLAAIFAIMAFLLFRKKSKRQIVISLVSEIKKPAEKAEKEPSQLEIREIEASDTGGSYLVRVVKKRGEDGKWCWHTPFVTLQDRTKPLFRDDFQAAKKAVRGCVKDRRYADQLACLLAKGEDVKLKG